ncbi:PREDICTED: TRAF-type zinc finger domain-containing protein 1-like [Cyprinodon variegatus]|uniref:TRAF-type zinc finger domain-containing protein 1-like n=1 Tax=Cyprinodon variegatus TaxID=28743 RepID=UPI00074268F4|nr:PREDICTED: TRAF-type zinc finger domain-containing protein 1-like [Cyprinodon variegatus]
METSEPEPTRTCGSCHKEVAEANFALHESHCRRFLSVCPDCDEAVPRELLSQHREEQHTQVKCSKCNKKMERCHLEDHERFCYLASPLLYDEEEEEEEDFYRDQLSAAYKATYSQVGGDPDQISTCPHCHLALPLSTLKWHEAKCRIHVFLKDREG